MSPDTLTTQCLLFISHLIISTTHESALMTCEHLWQQHRSTALCRAQWGGWCCCSRCWAGAPVSSCVHSALHNINSGLIVTSQLSTLPLYWHSMPIAKHGYLIQLCQMLCWFAIWFLLDLPSFRMYRIIRIRRMGIFSWFIILHYYQWRNNSQYFDRGNRQL